MKTFTTSIFIFLFFFPIAALAADAAAATWTIEDYLKAGFSGMVGGLIPLVGTLLVPFINNKHAKKAQKDAHNYHIAQLAYVEMKEVCRKYITMMSLDNIIEGEYDEYKIRVHLDIIALYTNNEFYNIALSLFQFLIEHKIDLLRCNNTNAHGDAISNYRAKYEILLNHTKKLLQAQ